MNDDMLELRMWRDGNIMHENCIEDMNKLKVERDEARREVCDWISNHFKPESREAVAERKGWDCYKETI